MNGFLVALKAEIFVARYTLGSKLVLLTPSLLVMLQYLLVKLTDASSAARDSLSGSSSFEAAIAGNA